MMQVGYRHLGFHPKVEILQALPGGVLAVCKPCGLLSHPNPSKNSATNVASSSSSQHQIPSKNSLIQAGYDHQKECYTLKQEGVMYKTFLTHRLDKGTSGIMLVSTAHSTAIQLRKQFKQRQIHKEYYALVSGTKILHGKRELWWEDDYAKEYLNDQIVRAKLSSSTAAFGNHPKSNTHQVHQYHPREVSVAITKVMIEAENHEKQLTLLRLQPSTGFTHQLRFQCALHHCPIIGDDIYGDYTYNKVHKVKRMYLHAHSIEGQYQHEEEVVRFQCQASLPIDFTTFFKSQ